MRECYDFWLLTPNCPQCGARARYTQELAAVVQAIEVDEDGSAIWGLTKIQDDCTLTKLGPHGGYMVECENEHSWESQTEDAECFPVTNAPPPPTANQQETISPVVTAAVDSLLADWIELAHKTVLTTFPFFTPHVHHETVFRLLLSSFVTGAALVANMGKDEDAAGNMNISAEEKSALFELNTAIEEVCDKWLAKYGR